MKIKIANNLEIHNFLEQYTGTKSVVWENDKNVHLILAMENEVIIGFSFVFKRLIPAPVGEKYELFINAIDVFDVKNQNNGIGSEMVKTIKDIAIHENVLQVRAYCDINNIPSHRLWLKNGFGFSPVKHSDGSILGSFVTYRSINGEYI